MTRFAIVLVLVASSSTAFGQPAGAQAEVLFRQGRELMTAGKVAEACNAFAESQKLEPAATTLINLAGCREKQGEIATAWGLFLDAERQTRSSSDATMQQLHDVAQTRAAKLEPRVSKLTINVPQGSQVDGLELSRDKDHVDAAMWNRALPIDGGTYTVSAHAPGTNTWSTQITIAPEGDTKTVDIPDLRSLPRDVTPAQPKPTTAAAPTTDDEDHSTSAHAFPVVPVVVGAGAIVLLGGALGFDLWGNSTYNDAKAEMTSQSRRDSLYDSANDRRYVAEGLAVGGIAAAGVAVWLYIRGRGEDSPPPTASRFVVSPAGVAFGGSF
jgi:hypothetical protein